MVPYGLHTSGSAFSLSPTAAVDTLMSARVFLEGTTGSFILNTSGIGPSDAAGFSSFALRREVSLVTGQQAFLNGLWTCRQNIKPGAAPPPHRYKRQVRP